MPQTSPVLAPLKRSQDVPSDEEEAKNNAKTSNHILEEKMMIQVQAADHNLSEIITELRDQEPPAPSPSGRKAGKK